MGMNKVRQNRLRYRFEAEGGTTVCSLALHNDRGDWLGYVTLEYNNEERWGQLMCVTDYGNYAYHWTAVGSDFIDFLLKNCSEYITEKVAQGHGEARELKAAESRERIREEFLRVSASEDPDWTGERLEALDACECEVDFFAWAEESGLDDVNGCFCYGWGGCLEGFCKVLLPELKRALAVMRG